jgi:hypothetical protein
MVSSPDYLLNPDLKSGVQIQILFKSGFQISNPVLVRIFVGFQIRIKTGIRILNPDLIVV